MAVTDKRKQSLYFPEEMLNEIQAEADRLDRSLSWVVQRAWRIAFSQFGRFASAQRLVAVPAAPAPESPPLPVTGPEPVTPPEGRPGSQVRDFISGKFESK